MGRNILWSESEEKCYIVDFERADMRFSSSANMPQEWREFEEWSLLD
jgi:predicted Ser/Thr protein kinase